jgi:hypothetical protein
VTHSTSDNVIALLTIAQAARDLGVCDMRLHRMVKKGTLVPNFRAGNLMLLNSDRLAELNLLVHPEVKAE